MLALPALGTAVSFWRGGVRYLASCFSGEGKGSTRVRNFLLSPRHLLGLYSVMAASFAHDGV